MHQRRRHSERGAVFIHVAIGLLVLLGFIAFVADYGLLWVSRNQAQNAADAGALAGAASLATAGGDDKARNAAWNVGIRNAVWGQPPGIVPTSPYYGEPCVSSPSSCVRVDAYRDGTNGSTELPTWFASLFGQSSQRVRAMAVAQIAKGNATECLKPWALIDRWSESWPQPVQPWSVDSTFDKYDNSGNPDPNITNPDSYTPMTDVGGTGFRPFDDNGQKTPDYGFPLRLKQGNANQFNAGWFQALSLPDQYGGTSGGDVYRNNIKGCSGLTYSIGQVLPDVGTEPGNMVGPTNQAVYDDVDSLCKEDPTAHWDPSLNGGVGGIVSPFGNSPRVVPVPLFSPEDVSKMKNGRATVTIQNIMGFFIHCPNNPDPAFPTLDNGEVAGRLVTLPGTLVSGGGTGGPDYSFFQVVRLVR